jgi:hypothetical protein
MPADYPVAPASETAREPSDEARRLEAAVTALSRAPLDPSYRAEAEALRALARAIEGISATSIAAERIRSAAERLSAPPASDDATVTAVSDALETAGGVLTVRGLGEHRDEHDDASLLYEAAVGRLDRGSSLLEQRGPVVAALRAATNLFHLLQSARPPFPADEVLRSWEKPKTFCDAVEQARARVRSLAVASSQQARASAADALFAVADVLALDPATSAHVAELANVRLEALALRGRSSLNGARGIKVALSRVLDLVGSVWTEPRLVPWLRTARHGVDAIDGGFVAFERAAVQDSFRTVLDLIVVHARATRACTRPGDFPTSDSSSEPAAGRAGSHP